MYKTSKRGGFTLIELLVVIAIIAILAAILFPVFAMAREKAKQATCTSNLKQMGMAIAAYCQDYDEFMPLASTGKWDSKAGYSYIWISGIHPYIANCAWDGGGRNTSKVIFCPADDKEIFLYNGNKKISNYAYAGKLGNMSIADDNYKPRTLAKCLSTSTCAVIIDGKCQSRSSALFDIVNPASAGNYLAPRHADGLSVLYADNHVAWFNTKSASQAQIDTIFRWNTYKDWPY